MPLDIHQRFQHHQNMEGTIALATHAASAQAVRLRIHRGMIRAAPLGMTPGELSAIEDVPGSMLSCRLNEPTHAGLVTASTRAAPQSALAEIGRNGR